MCSLKTFYFENGDSTVIIQGKTKLQSLCIGGPLGGGCYLESWGGGV